MQADNRPVAIVTGGGRGIGRAIAEQLLAASYRVAIFERDDAARTAAQQALTSADVQLLDVDVGDEESVRRGVASTLSAHGRLDALVNNAALSDPYNAPVAELELEEWERVLRINLTGQFLCVKHSVEPLRRSGQGAVVQVASTRALQSEPNHEIYATAKGGLLALTHALALSLGPAIRVNAVSPGWIDTREPGSGSSELREIDHRQHPVGRVGLPRDVAGLVVYLLSPAASFITGQNFVIDGGMSKKMIYAE